MPAESSKLSNLPAWLEHIKISGDELLISGEHMISHAGPLTIQPNFFGAEEAITDYRPDSNNWVATIIHTAATPDQLISKRAQTIENIRRQLGLLHVVDSSPDNTKEQMSGNSMTLLKDDDIRNIAKGLRNLRQPIKSHYRIVSGKPGLPRHRMQRTRCSKPDRIITSIRYTDDMRSGCYHQFFRNSLRDCPTFGIEAHVTDRTDIAGLAEAFERHADIIITADDCSFVAIHTGTRRVADNARAPVRVLWQD